MDSPSEHAHDNFEIKMRIVQVKKFFANLEIAQQHSFPASMWGESFPSRTLPRRREILMPRHAESE